MRGTEKVAEKVAAADRWEGKSGKVERKEEETKRRKKEKGGQHCEGTEDFF